jgi:dihydroneopterin aldolase
VRHAWVKRCIELAKAKQDISLIETLLVVVKQRLAEYPELKELIIAHQDHPRIRKAVKRCKVEVM